MRKKLLGLCLVLSLGVLSACGKGESTSAEPESVQAVAETTAEQDTVESTSEGATVSEETMTTETETKTVYLLAKSVCYSEGEELPSLTEYEYNNQGNMIKETFYWGNGSVGYIYMYDSYGNLIRESSYSDGSIYFDLEYKNEYDDKGLMVKSTEYVVNDGSLRHTTEYEYDAEGNLIKDVEYFADGNEGSVTEYDDKGNMIRWISRIQNIYNEIVSHTGSAEYEYDSHGNIIKETRCIDEDTFITVIEYDYDGDCIMKETGYEEDGSVSFAVEYEYDSHNNLIKKMAYTEDFGSYTEEYEYITMELEEEK